MPFGAAKRDGYCKVFRAANYFSVQNLAFFIIRYLASEYFDGKDDKLVSWVLIHFLKMFIRTL